ncbi:MAG: cation diffusion facilitator family transporter [Planctomycetes bacterium]|nr:cation diffusion facilitator family transporter [Planctomycetota bacterium]
MTKTQTDYQRCLRLSVVSLLVNAGLATVKLLAGLLGHSYALIADAVESFSDIVASLVVWSGLRIAAAPADENHPYGHGKAEALAALIVALLLFVASGTIAIQAVREILAPHHAPAAYTLWVLLGVIAIKEGLFRIMRRAARSTGSGVLLADAWHHRSDALTSLAAAIGITIALIGGSGYEQADEWAALFAAGVIVVNAVRLIRPPLHELMDAEPTEIIDRVRATASQVPGVVAIEKVFGRKGGMRYWIDIHVEVDPDMTVHAAHSVAHDVKDAIRTELPAVQDVLVHIEPASAATADSER